MKKKRNEIAASKTIITLLTVLCVALIGISLLGGTVTGPVYSLTGLIVTPMQKGISRFGSWISAVSANFTDTGSLREENASLQEQVDSLMAENSQLVLDKEELTRLRTLLKLSEEYSEYETVGANVISRGSDDWFNTFTIDKGTSDGVEVDCNVMAGAGLVGIVTQTGPNWATVRAIIDDNSNVSAMVSTTSDTCIIAGSLSQIDEGSINLVKLKDEDNQVHVGDKVVTSNISEKFLPGILIGYISELNNDANNLTKSGKITPVVDFAHLQEVLVITQKKDYVSTDSDASSENEVVNDVTPVEDDDTGEEQENEE